MKREGAVRLPPLSFMELPVAFIIPLAVHGRLSELDARAITR